LGLGVGVGVGDAYCKFISQKVPSNQII